MIPGVGQQLGNLNVDERELDRLQAIITSMTPEERANPQDHRRVAPAPDRARLGDERAGRIQLVKQFAQMKKMMKQMAGRQDAVAAAVGRRSMTSPGGSR